VALVAAAGTALIGAHVRTPPSSPDVVDAAAQRNAQGVGPAYAHTAPSARASAASTAPQSAGRRHGDHLRAKPQQQAAATTTNANCTLVVPAAPTSAGGLATPYQLVATDSGAGACHEANADQSAFVEAAVFDPAAHALSIYHPLVVDQGDRPAVPPVPVTLPAGAVVGIWFGFNGDTLTLTGPGAGSCVNGLPGSPFGQFAYCNAPALFSAANADATFRGSLPAQATSPRDGLPCPTTRDFSVVDQDQSDNLVTAYRVIGGRMAQTTPDTAKAGTKLTNGSDEGLVANFIDPALGCTPPTAPDLTNGGAPTPSLALNELFAAARQGTGAALVPTSDPMVQVDGATSTRKTDLYRAGVDMAPLPEGQTPQAYCAALRTLAPQRLAVDAASLAAAPAPDPAAPDLLTFLRDRLGTTLANLGCQPLDAPAAASAAANAPSTTAASTTAAPTTASSVPAAPTTAASVPAAPKSTAPKSTAQAPDNGTTTTSSPAVTSTPATQQATQSPAQSSTAGPTRSATTP
jgi:hypothetical protein